MDNNILTSLTLTDNEIITGRENIKLFMYALAFIVFIIVVGYTITRVKGRPSESRWSGSCDCN